jgi:hypothetical protein
MAHPSDRFGFKPPTATDIGRDLQVQEATPLINRNRRRQDSYGSDQSESGADEHCTQDQEDAHEFRQGADNDFTGYEDDSALYDPLAEELPTGSDRNSNGDNSERQHAVTYGVLERHHAKNGRPKAPSPTRLSSVHGFSLLEIRNADLLY